MTFSTRPSIDLFNKSKIIVFSPEPLYHYYQSGESITTRGFSKQKLTGVEAHIMIFEKISKLYPQLTEVAFSTLLAMEIGCCSGIIMQENRQWDDALKVLKSSIRKSAFKGLLNSHLAIRKKVCLLLIFLPRQLTKSISLFLKNSKTALAKLFLI